MAKNFSITVVGGDDRDPVTAGNLHRTVAEVCSYLKGAAGGARATATTLKVAADSGRATGTITIASGAGATAAVINGVSVSVTWATSDTATAAALAAAINASVDALVAGHVTATSSAGVVTIKAVQPGVAGNTITIDGTGTGVTESGTRLTGGATTSTFSL